MPDISIGRTARPPGGISALRPSDELLGEVAAALGLPVAVEGFVGSNALAWSATLRTGRRGRAFLRWSSEPRAWRFECEARGLEMLRARGCAAPDVLAVSERFIAVEHLRQARVGRGGAFEQAARVLRRAHVAAHDDATGPGGARGCHATRGYWAGLSLPEAAGSWSEVVETHWLRPALDAARRQGWMEPGEVRRACAGLRAALSAANVVPADLHGAIRPGKVVVAGGGPLALVGPSPVRGDAWWDVACALLAGGPARGLARAYVASAPPPPDWPLRRRVYVAVAAALEAVVTQEPGRLRRAARSLARLAEEERP